MSLANKATSFPKTREWTSFRGSAVPLSSDPFEMGEDFIRALHHRLCQPLTALSCTLELMQIGREADHLLCEQLRSAVEQSDRIMNTMAMFRRLFEAAAPSVSCASFLGHVITEVIEDLRPVADHDQIILVLETKNKANVMVEEGQLRQSLWGLLHNCIESTPERGMVKVKTDSTRVIVDDGCIASSIDIDNIFDPFSFCGSRKDSSRVSNLPLAVLQRTMVSSGGNICVVGGKAGRRFELRYPRGKDSVTD